MGKVGGRHARLIVIDEVAKIDPKAFELLTSGDPDELRKQYMQEPDLPTPPPRILSNESKSPHFHPCYTRVGVRIDGVDRNDISYYNMDDRSYKTAKNTSHLATAIEPYWRYSASRQQRRAEERWAK